MDEFQGDLNSEGIIADEKYVSPSSKKYLIIAGVTGAFILLLIIIIILMATSGGSGSGSGSKDEDKNSRVKMGEIICKYDVSDSNAEIKILGENFKINEDITMTIDKEINLSRNYKFKNVGENNVIFNIYSNQINMDNMFKDISSLETVVMDSVSNNVIITSMVSSFENCEKLKKVTNSGFKTSEIKSMKRTFYKSNIESLEGITTENVEDFSYMFASVSKSEINLDNIDTRNAKNFSHMFEKSDISELNFKNFDTSKVVDMSYMFNGCESLFSLDL